MVSRPYRSVYSERGQPSSSTVWVRRYFTSDSVYMNPAVSGSANMPAPTYSL